MNTHPTPPFRILRRHAGASIPAPGESSKETDMENRRKVGNSKP